MVAFVLVLATLLLNTPARRLLLPGKLSHWKKVGFIPETFMELCKGAQWHLVLVHTVADPWATLFWNWVEMSTALMLFIAL